MLSGVSDARRFEVAIGRESGAIERFSVGDTQLITSALAPNYWRAPTDNDVATGCPKDAACGGATIVCCGCPWSGLARLGRGLARGTLPLGLDTPRHTRYLARATS